MKGKILIVFEESSRVDFGGGQRMTLTTCDILKEHFDFRFVDFSSTTRFDRIIGETYPESSLVDIGGGGIKSKYRYLAWVKAIKPLLFHFKRDAERVVEGLDTSNAISYVTNKRSLLYAYYLNKKYHIPFIYHAHLVENPKGFYYSLFKKMVAKAESILCVSKTVLNSIPLPQSKLVYNPSMNEKGYKGEKKDNHFVVAYVGGLIPIKGVEYFVDAAKLCPADVEFRAYGDGVLRQSLEERAEGRVKFMGFCTDMISEYYKDVDILVVPTILKEALPLVAVDAKSTGIPVVTTCPGGQAEIVEDGVNGYHVPMKNAMTIAERVMQMVNNLEQYNQMSKASYESFGDFSYENYKETVNAVFGK